MSEPANRAQFIDWCKRSLGHPVIEINVDDDQVDDRVDEALEFWTDYHYDGSEKLYLKHRITQQDRERRYIIIPDRIIGVTGVLSFDDSAASVNLFDLRYQLRLHDLYDFTSVSYVPYTITMQHLRTLQMLFAGEPQVRFHRHRNRLHLDVNWNSIPDIDSSNSLGLNSYVIIECYGKINGDNITLHGTYSTTAGSMTITGSNVDREISRDDEITIRSVANGQINTTVTQVNSNASFNVAHTFTSTESGLQIYIVGNSDVWNDRVLKDLGTAYIKKQWGNNLKKFGNIQMPGGVTLNGQQIYDEAVGEIDKMKAEFLTWNTLQSDFLVG